MLEELLAEIENLKQAKDLLEQVYLATGPYGERPIPEDLCWKINGFFKFDDSE
jgi:ribulose bisphosphate carboxylase small subunit